MSGITLEKRGSTALLTISNPPANTWTEESLNTLAELVETLNHDKDIYARIAEFKDEHGRDPQTGSHDDIEHRLAIALQKLMVWAQEQANKEVEEDQEQMSFREEL